MLVVSL
jgi:hypothetical protein